MIDFISLVICNSILEGPKIYEFISIFVKIYEITIYVKMTHSMVNHT